MVNVILKIVVVVIMAGLLFAFCRLAQETPNVVTGVKHHKRGEKDKARKKLKEISKVMNWMPTLTLLGGIPSAIFGYEFLYFLFLLAPCVVGSLYIYLIMPKKK